MPEGLAVRDSNPVASRDTLPRLMRRTQAAAEGRELGMDLTTNYMGFHLKGPLIVGAGPMSDTLDRVKRVEDAGASAVVLRSLFEDTGRRALHLTAEDVDGLFAPLAG